MKGYLIILCSVIFLFIQVKAQDEYSVSNIRLSYDKVSQQVNISYDLLPSGSSGHFKVVPEMYFSNGQKINATAFTGEGIENYTNCGTGKIIKWNPAKDNERFNKEIYAVLFVKREINISTGSHMMKSLIFPGWGDYRLGNSWYYGGFGVIAYGGATSAILYNRMAADTYNNYKNSFDINQSDKLLTDAKTQQKISNILAISSAAIWAIDLARVYIKSQKVKKDIKTSNYYFERSNVIFSNRSENYQMDNRTPFDIALEDGNNEFIKGSFSEAKSKYEAALNLEPTNSLAKLKLDETNRILAELKVKEDKYHALVAKADSSFKVKDYSSAKGFYNEALGLIPDKPYPKQQLNEIAKILEKERNDKEYNERISAADVAFNQNNFQTAKGLYQQALLIYQSEPYPKNKVQECDNHINEKNYSDVMSKGNSALNTNENELAVKYFDEALSYKPDDVEAQSKLKSAKQRIAEINQKKLDDEYRKYIEIADNYYDKKEFDNAETYYQKALAIKFDTYPNNRIESIKKKNEIIIAEKNDLSSLYEKNKKAVFLIFSEDYSTTSQGSGFFISSSGYAISNAHVFQKTYLTSNYIYTSDGKKYEIEKIVKKNEDLDYIIFKVKPIGAKKFPYLKIAFALPKIGEDIFTIGNPDGLEQTLSKGIVSAFRDEKTYIQTDAPITHGSSGGPLMNMKGEVIGITSFGKQEGSLFFALSILEIPLEMYKE